MSRYCPRCSAANPVAATACGMCGYPFGLVGHAPVPATAKPPTAFGALVAVAVLAIMLVVVVVMLASNPLNPATQGGVLPPGASNTQAAPDATATADSVASLINIPTVTPDLRTTPPNIVPTLAPTSTPPTDTLVATQEAVPTSTVSLPPTSVVRSTATALPPTNMPQPTTGAANISPYLLRGAYKRDDGRLYGREEVALYGAGSGYDAGTVSFELRDVPTVPLALDVLGLDDERPDPLPHPGCAERCDALR